MTVTITATPKEVADLVEALQSRQEIDAIVATVMARLNDEARTGLRSAIEAAFGRKIATYGTEQATQSRN